MNIASTGAAVVLMAALGSIILIRRNSSQQPIHVKAVFFGLYFWGLVFLQLIVVAVFLAKI
jgi:hypothetical protein